MDADYRRQILFEKIAPIPVGNHDARLGDVRHRVRPQFPLPRDRSGDRSARNKNDRGREQKESARGSRAGNPRSRRQRRPGPCASAPVSLEIRPDSRRAPEFHPARLPQPFAVCACASCKLRSRSCAHRVRSTTVASARSSSRTVSASSSHFCASAADSRFSVSLPTWSCRDFPVPTNRPCADSRGHLHRLRLFGLHQIL